MAFADTSTYFDTGDGSIIGGFEEKTCENFFEFSAASAEEIDNSFGTISHRIWVTTPWKSHAGHTMDCGYRLGNVLKTVAYLIVDEDEFGEPIVKKWNIRNHREYTRPIEEIKKRLDKGSGL